VVAHHQRQRILDGAAVAIAKSGYRAVTVADIVKSATIARARFYENYGSKEECFFALYDAATEEASELVAEACAQTPDAKFPERVRAGVGALLSFLDENPERARACIVEGPAVGAPISARFESVIEGFAALLREGRGTSAQTELPDRVEETVVGGVYWLLYYALLDAKPPNVVKLSAQLTEFSLIPFIGAERARAATA
jgi:AcrR family transcriptional regulator